MSRKFRRRKNPVQPGPEPAPKTTPGNQKQIAKNLQNGYAHHQAGRMAEAQACYEAILADQPDHPDTLYLSGTVYLQQGDFETARERLTAAVTANPGLAEAHCNLGIVLRELGDPQSGLESCQRALAITPDYGDALNNKGLALKELERYQEAEAAYRKALELKPDNPETIANLGSLLRLENKLDESELVFKHGLETCPANHLLYHNYGVLLDHIGDTSGALKAFRQAVAIKPNYVTALTSLGMNLEQSGEIDEAAVCFRRALTIEPGNVQARKFLTALEGENVSQTDILQMEDLISSATVSHKERVHLSYALGRAHEKTEDYNRAFEYFKKGAELKRSSTSYNIHEDELLIERIIKTMTADLLRGKSGAGNMSDLPIFILGMPRSGTTLVEQILASHSQVFGADELSEMALAINTTREEYDLQEVYPEIVGDMSAEMLSRSGEAYVDALQKIAPGSPRVTDKMPSNFIYIGLIHLILPNAKIIHCRRNPIDTCLGCYKVEFIEKLDYTYDLESLGRYYRAYDRLMTHWHDLLPGKIYDLSYEALVANQEDQTRKLLEFCNLPWEDNCLSFQDTKRTVRTASSSQVRKPIYKSALGRWKKYASHLGPLLQALGPLADESEI